MVGDPDYVFNSDKGGLINTESKGVKDSRIIAAFHNPLYSVCGYSSSIIILGFLSILPLTFIFILESYGLYISSVFEFFAIIIPGCVYLSSMGYTVYSLGKWVKNYFEGCWARSIPPHEDLRNAVPFQILSHILFGYTVNYYQPTGRDKDKFIPVAVSLSFLVLLILISSIFLVTLGDQLGFLEGFENWVSQEGEVEVDGTISFFTASLSVLLGPVIGLITLGIFALAVSPTDVIILLFVIATPSIAFAPVFRNSVWYLKQRHYELFGGPSMKSIAGLVICSIINLSIIAVIFALSV